MRWRIPLDALLPVLPPEVSEEVKSIVGDDTEAVVCRRATADRSKALDPGEREVLHYVSTRDIDRDAEILDPAGAVLSEFKKAPHVLWAHDYSLPPVGSDRLIESDGYGLRAITRYAETDLGNDLWMLRRDGHLRTASVGFVSLKATANGSEGWSKLVGKLGTKWNMEPQKFEGVKNIITKWLVLEHSDVSVAANVNATTIAVGKSAGRLLVEEGEELRDLVTKGGIKTPFLCQALLKTATLLIAQGDGDDIEDDEALTRSGPGSGDETKAGGRALIIEREPVRFVQPVQTVSVEKTARMLVLQARGQLG